MGKRVRMLDPMAYKATNRGAWVYFIREERSGPIKIGYAWRVIDRLNCAQVGNPRRLYLIGVIYVAEDEPLMRGILAKNTKRMERELHARFAHARIRGEWFAPVDALLEFIAALPKPGAR